MLVVARTQGGAPTSLCPGLELNRPFGALDVGTIGLRDECDLLELVCSRQVTECSVDRLVVFRNEAIVVVEFEDGPAWI